MFHLFGECFIFLGIVLVVTYCDSFVNCQFVLFFCRKNDLFALSMYVVCCVINVVCFVVLCVLLC
jgi:hypothetical protein